LADLLAQTRFAQWASTPMSGDASSRRYARLTGSDGETAILMDAAAEPAEALAAFRRIGAALTAMGLAAPRELWANQAARVLVLEDLGPHQFAIWLAAHPEDEIPLYAAAVDILVRLQSCAPPPCLVALDPGHAAAMTGPFFDWYRPETPQSVRTAITASLTDLLARHAGPADRLALRDYHAENLIWRPDRTGTDRVGLLDFQDAVLAPPEYDLVSLLRDARRDVAEATRLRMLDRFAAATGRPLTTVTAAAAVLGIQRNLRILGIFARLARRDGKTRYLGLLPRVLAHVESDLAHPALSPLRDVLAGVLPLASHARVSE
jgi:N-acetylmuramate 1-kinase